MDSILERLEEWKKDIEKWPIIIGSDALSYEESKKLLELLERGIKASRE